MSAKKRILVAPLNWGLGHATRCVPLIRSLLRLGVEPVLASDGRSLQLLRSEFPALPWEELPGYGIRYGRGGMVWTMARQSPKIALAALREHRRVSALTGRYRIGGILADNRYGCFHPGTPSAILCHQLNLRLPHPLLAGPVDRWHQFLLRRFDECWVPDWPGPDNLSGALSHPPSFPGVRYTGGLSRLTGGVPAGEGDSLVILLSGPEPQRSRLEALLREQVGSVPGRILFLLGKPEGPANWREEGRTREVAHLSAEDLNEVLRRARLVVCRPGYSTLLDLSALGKRALFIPTPGQTEQLYLGERMQKKGWGIVRRQTEVHLAVDVPEALKLTGLPRRPPADPAPFLAGWLERIGF